MLDRIFDFFLSEPQRLIALGRALVRTGGGIVIVGLVGHVATTATGALHRLGAQAAPPQSLAELYPMLWTWWVPETIPAHYRPSAWLVLASGWSRSGGA